MPDLHRGEVWWAEIPDEKRRPVLVLSREAVLPYLEWIVVAPLTGTARSVPTEVGVGPADGLPQSSVVALDALRTIWRAHLTQRIGALTPARMADVCLAARTAIDC